MSESRSLDQIEEELSKARESLTASVNELAGRLTPGSLAAEAKAQAKAKAGAAVEKVKDLVDEAKAGDQKAIAILGGAAAATVGLIALALRR